MEEENRELKRQIESLKSELEASIRREDMLLHPYRGRDYIKQKLKNTAIGRVATNPDSIGGKLIRLPRTMYRIVMHPSIMKEIKGKKNEDFYKDKNGRVEEILVPVRFFIGVDNPRRVNLLVERLDDEILKMAIEIANKENIELRVVTYGEGAGSVKYARFLKKKLVPKAKRISFYSSVDQVQKNKMFELEIGQDDIFLTKVWERDEEARRSK